MNLVSHRFGRLVVRSFVSGGPRPKWRCACDCGNTVVRAQGDLRMGDTKSCGCLKRETTVRRNTTHGGAKTPAYTKWASMWNRVRYPVRNSACYAGVTVCERWKKFENFYADMGDPPKGYTLERKRNTVGYCKSNCLWVPKEDQARNTSRNVRVKWKGKKVCVSEAARSAGLRPDVVFDRINYLGWTLKRALSTPVRKLVRNSERSSKNGRVAV